MKKFEDILAQCIEDVKAGRSSIDDCLARYPSISKQLEPLLRIALEIQEPPDVKPSPTFKVRARVQLMEQIHAGQAVTKWPWSRYTYRLQPIPYKRRFSMVAIIIAIVLAVSAAGGGTAYASQGSLPGDVLYPVKLGTENVRAAFAGSDTDKAELYLTFANRRVEEMTSLTEKGRPEDVPIAVNGYDNAMAMAIEKMQEARGKGLATANVSEVVALGTSKHLEVLEGLLETVPEEAVPGIEKAIEVSMTGQENALRALAGENLVRAVEINLSAMEGRLNRAKAKAEENDIGELGNALLQFEEFSRFGEEISDIARGLGQDTTDIEELIALATSIHLTALDGVTEIIAEEAQEAVARAREVSITSHGNALRVLARENPVRAMEINLSAIEGRLNRANAEADENDIEGVEIALADVEELRQFGQEISDIARGLGEGTTTIDELVARATAIHLEVLAQVLEKLEGLENVPEEATQAIERAIGESAAGYQRATEALKEAGALGNIPEELPIPEGIPDKVKEKLEQSVPSKPSTPAGGRP